MRKKLCPTQKLFSGTSSRTPAAEVLLGPGDQAQDLRCDVLQGHGVESPLEAVVVVGGRGLESRGRGPVRVDVEPGRVLVVHRRAVVVEQELECLARGFKRLLGS